MLYIYDHLHSKEVNQTTLFKYACISGKILQQSKKVSIIELVNIITITEVRRVVANKRRKD